MLLKAGGAGAVQTAAGDPKGCARKRGRSAGMLAA